MRGAPIVKTVDEYLNTLPVEVSRLLQHVREIITSTAPEATESISYGIPAYKYHGPLVYFGAAKHHCALYGGSGELVQVMKEELAGYSISKGTIRFTVQDPLPDKIIKKIVKIRMEENESKSKRNMI